MPKLYFYDTGLACSLLGMENEQELTTYYQKGELFENLIINELLKSRLNNGYESNLFFWRNNHGNEVDCIVDKFNRPIAVEIKSSATYSSEFLKNIKYWNKLSDQSPENSFLVYSGDNNQKVKHGNILSWNTIEPLLAKV